MTLRTVLFLVAVTIVGCGKKDAVGPNPPPPPPPPAPAPPPPPPAPGTVQVTTATTGADQDPDGYLFTIDAGVESPIGPNASVSIPNVAVGDHQVELKGLATNCTTASNPRTVSVTSGGTVAAAFSVGCQLIPTLGAIQVKAVTLGIQPDPDGYSYTLDGGAAKSIGSNATDTIPDLAPGSHTLVFSGVASNCTALATTVVATVVVGQVAPARFDSQCAATGRLLVDLPDGGIYQVGVDGSGLIRLTDSGEGGRWSPDGAKVVFTSFRDGNAEIYTMNANGSAVTRLTVDPGSDGFPDWSPDGTRIVFSSNRGGSDAIYVMQADGSNVVKLTNPTLQHFSPSWLAVVNRIAYQSNDNSPDEIRTMAPDGTDVRLFGTGSGPLRRSPLGDKMAFSRFETQSSVIKGWVLTIANIDGTNAVAVTRPTSDLRYDGRPVWSSDGLALGFTRTEGAGSGPHRPMLMSFNGGLEAIPGVPEGSISDWRP